MTEPIHILSLGAGVQSSAMALMAAVGEVTPMPAFAVFADTGDEPDDVYTWLERLRQLLPFRVKIAHKPFGSWVPMENRRLSANIIVDALLAPRGEFLTADLKRIDDIDFSRPVEKSDDPNQMNLFGNECEGMCGV